jgi:hypothetical protein
MILLGSAAATVAVLAVNPALPAVKPLRGWGMAGDASAQDPKVGTPGLLVATGLHGPGDFMVHTDCGSCSLTGDTDLEKALARQGVFHLVVSESTKNVDSAAARAGQIHYRTVRPEQLKGWNAYRSGRTYRFDGDGRLQRVWP